MKFSPVLMFRFIVLFAGLCAFPGASPAQSYPPVWNNTAHYVAGDMVTDYGNVYRCISAVTTPYLDPSKTYQHWELNYVRSGTTITIGIGQPFPTLETAWAYALNATIAQGAYLHLNIVTSQGDYSETMSTHGFSLNHPFGNEISISGDNVNNVHITVPNLTSEGFYVNRGYSFGTLANVSMSQAQESAVAIYSAGNIDNLSNDSISGFNTALQAENGGQISCGETLTISNNVNGAWANQFGRIFLANGQVLTGVTSMMEGEGLYASDGGQIEAFTCSVSGFGADANELNNSTIQARGGSMTHATEGLEAQNGGFIDFVDGTTSDNTNDILAGNGGRVNATGASYATSSVDSGHGSYIDS